VSGYRHEASAGEEVRFARDSPLEGWREIDSNPRSPVLGQFERDLI
jgi:hypothetical protein